MKDSDPIGYEKLFSRLRGGLVSARETALNISASPIVRELGRALLRALHARGRLDRALHRDHRPRPHDVRRDQVDGPAGLRGQPGDPARATSSPTTTRRSATSTTPTCRPSSRSSTSATPRARAGRLGRRRHPRARHRRLDPGRGAGRPHEPPRRRDRPPVHEDRRRRRDRPLAPGALREADPGADVLPARRAHAARRLPHDPRGGRAGDPRGGPRPLQAVQPRGDRGGPALVQGPDPRDDRPRALPGGLVHGQHLRRQGPAARAGAARLRHARAVRGPDRRRRRLRARPRRRVRLGLALDELHPVGDAGGDLGDVHADADLQRQGQRRRLLRGRDELPRGLDRQPRRRRGLDRDRLGVPAAGVHRLPAHALARAAGARLHRGGDRRLLGLRQRDPGRRRRPVRQLLGDHELRDRGPGDGGQVRARRHRHLRGDVQPRGRRRRRRDVGADLPDGLPLAADQAEHRRPRAPPRRLELRVAAADPQHAVLGAAEPRHVAPVHLAGDLRRLPGLDRLHPQHPRRTTCASWPRPGRPTRSPTARSTTRR